LSQFPQQPRYCLQLDLFLNKTFLPNQPLEKSYLELVIYGKNTTRAQSTIVGVPGR
jgi:hypothetical protein